MFDPESFHISIKEAVCMDPQQRLVLEVAYDVLHNSLNTNTINEGAVGVYLGACYSEYTSIFRKLTNQKASVFTATSSGLSVIPGDTHHLPKQLRFRLEV